MSMPTLSNEELKNNIINMLCDCDIRNSSYATGTQVDYDMAADAVLKLLATQNTALLKEVADKVIGADETSLGCEVCDSFMTGEHDPWNCQPDNYCPNCKHHYDGKCTNKSGISRVEIEPRNTLRAEQRSKLAAMGGQ